MCYILSMDKSTIPVKKLWNLLVTKKVLQEDFVHFIYKRRKSPINDNHSVWRSEDNAIFYETTPNPTPLSQTYKIVHKDQDSIHGFCLNEKDKHIISLCTSKEILEIDFKNLLRTEGNDDDMGVEQQQQEMAYDANTSSIYEMNMPHNRSTIMTRRNIREVRKLASHPTLPYCKYFSIAYFIV